MRVEKTNLSKLNITHREQESNFGSPPGHPLFPDGSDIWRETRGNLRVI